MDMRMPEMTGIALCKLLREKTGKAVKIYAITAQVLPDEREFLLSNGFDGLVMKPFKENELLSVFFEAAEPPQPEEIELDLRGLKKMTFDDDAQLNRILLRFADDCLDDSEAIRGALAAGDKTALSLLTHRLAGRIAQIGSKKLAAEFRFMEIELEGNGPLDLNRKNKILDLLQQLNQLLNQVRQLA
ncbi:Sensor protein EvgS precursor [compost metagenome]